jgi:hypothetical protein
VLLSAGAPLFAQNGTGSDTRPTDAFWYGRFGYGVIEAR